MSKYENKEDTQPRSLNFEHNTITRVNPHVPAHCRPMFDARMRRLSIWHVMNAIKRNDNGKLATDVHLHKPKQADNGKASDAERNTLHTSFITADRISFFHHMRAETIRIIIAAVIAWSSNKDIPTHHQHRIAPNDIVLDWCDHMEAHAIN